MVKYIEIHFIWIRTLFILHLLWKNIVSYYGKILYHIMEKYCIIWWKNIALYLDLLFQQLPLQYCLNDFGFLSLWATDKTFGHSAKSKKYDQECRNYVLIIWKSNLSKAGKLFLVLAIVKSISVCLFIIIVAEYSTRIHRLSSLAFSFFHSFLLSFFLSIHSFLLSFFPFILSFFYSSTYLYITGA